jgi:hypothetical protein
MGVRLAYSVAAPLDRGKSAFREPGFAWDPKSDDVSGGRSELSEVWERAYPQYDHWNFGRVGEALSSAAIEKNLEYAKKYKLSKVIYLFNLNREALTAHAPTGDREAYLSSRYTSC